MRRVLFSLGASLGATYTPFPILVLPLEISKESLQKWQIRPFMRVTLQGLLQMQFFCYLFCTLAINPSPVFPCQKEPYPPTVTPLIFYVVPLFPYFLYHFSSRRYPTFFVVEVVFNKDEQICSQQHHWEKWNDFRKPTLPDSLSSPSSYTQINLCLPLKSTHGNTKAHLDGTW